MNRIAALGEAVKVEGFALAGALVLAADGANEVDAAWDVLPEDVAVLIVTPSVEHRLASRFGDRPHLLTVVCPE
jgi:vacuolar-type H+-ATPase subunit F/Vma7